MNEAPVEPHRQRSPLSRAMKSGPGPLNVRQLGVPRRPVSDLYHRLLRTSWPRLAILFAATFIAYNLLFAGLYTLDPGALEIVSAPSHATPFWRAFFFSVHTVATVGYGNIYPRSLYANVLVVVEITLGILFFALTTGITFARFSRPTARIIFSRVAVINPVDGVPTLMIRAANQRQNLIYEATVRVSLLRSETVDGHEMRRFRDLKLVRQANPVFALSWTIMHPIDEDSPLHGMSEAELADSDDDLIVVLAGVDESMSQTIYGRWGYAMQDIRWNARFADIIGEADDGVRTIDYAAFNETEPA